MRILNLAAALLLLHAPALAHPGDHPHNSEGGHRFRQDAENLPQVRKHPAAVLEPGGLPVVGGAVNTGGRAPCRRYCLP